MRVVQVVLSLVVGGACGLPLACSAADPEPEPGPPGSCNQEDRSGAYMKCANLATGDCGPIGCEVVSSVAALDADCREDSTSWSDFDCTFERRVTCTDPVSGNLTITVTTTRQMTEDGSRLEGTMTMENTTGSGQPLCSGTYEITYERTDG